MVDVIHEIETACALVFRQGNGTYSNKECAVLICHVSVPVKCERAVAVVNEVCVIIYMYTRILS